MADVIAVIWVVVLVLLGTAGWQAYKLGQELRDLEHALDELARKLRRASGGDNG